jgi:hypothetical protein
MNAAIRSVFTATEISIMPFGGMFLNVFIEFVNENNLN